MQLLDDDMDELFRKAASQYPLKTDGADWDALNRRLRPEGNDAVPPVFETMPAKPVRKWFWWRGLPLLLLFMGAGIYWLSVQQNKKITGTDTLHNAHTNTVTTQNTNAQKSSTTNNNTQATNTTVQNEPADNATAQNTTVTTPAANAATQNATAQKGAGAAANTTAKSTAAITITQNANTTQQNTSTNTTTPKTQSINAEGLALGNGKSSSGRQENNATNTVTHTVFVPVSYATGTSNGNGSTNKNQSATHLAADTVSIRGYALNGYRESVGQVKREDLQTITAYYKMPSLQAVKDTLTVSPLPAGTPKEKVVIQPGLYAGIIISPDVSTVKGQAVKALGYNIGAVVGYRISKHFAVETGALWERKNYYSEGQYFSTKKIPAAQNLKIVDVNGYCKMIEIPLNVRYLFAVKQNSSWYGDAGLSSYLMSRESYNYDYIMNYTYGNKTWNYKNSTRDWFSVIQLGVGYERKVGKLGMLRVEPYVKLPTSGIGIGHLPVTSFGLNLGITRNIRW